MTTNQLKNVLRLVNFFIITISVFVGCDSVIENNVDPSNNTITFMATKPDNDSVWIFTMKSDGSDLKEISKGYSSYPTWYEYPDKILAIEKRINPMYGNIEYLLKLFTTNDDVISESYLSGDIGNRLFLKYSPVKNSVAFSELVFTSPYQKYSQVGYLDLNKYEIRELSLQNYNYRNPVWSKDGETLYFSADNNGTYDIFNINSGGSELKQFIIDNDFDLTTFDISKDEKMLVASRYNKIKSYISVYSIKEKRIEYNIDVSEYGTGLYPTFTSDGKKIIFVNGIPNNYQIPRNIHIMDLNGENQRQLTFSQEFIVTRPQSY